MLESLAYNCWIHTKLVSIYVTFSLHIWFHYFCIKHLQYRTAIKVMFLYFNLCLGEMLDSLSHHHLHPYPFLLNEWLTWLKSELWCLDVKYIVPSTSLQEHQFNVLTDTCGLTIKLIRPRFNKSLYTLIFT
jgi:hypothetical protein